MAHNYIYTIDVAHPARKAAATEEILTQAWLHVRNHPHLRVIKVIHGYGSGGRSGKTRETMRNWAFRNRRHFQEIIYGEDYSIMKSETQEMRSECGMIDDIDLDRDNPGITLIWVH